MAMGSSQETSLVCDEFLIALLHFSCAGWKDFNSPFCLAQNQHVAALSTTTAGLGCVRLLFNMGLHFFSFFHHTRGLSVLIQNLWIMHRTDPWSVYHLYFTRFMNLFSIYSVVLTNLKNYDKMAF